MKNKTFNPKPKQRGTKQNIKRTPTVTNSIDEQSTPQYAIPLLVPLTPTFDQNANVTHNELPVEIDDDANHLSLEGTLQPIVEDTPIQEDAEAEEPGQLFVDSTTPPEPLGRAFNEEGRLVSTRTSHQPQRGDFDFYS